MRLRVPSLPLISKLSKILILPWHQPVPAARCAIPPPRAMLVQTLVKAWLGRVALARVRTPPSDLLRRPSPAPSTSHQGTTHEPLVT